MRTVPMRPTRWLISAAVAASCASMACSQGDAVRPPPGALDGGADVVTLPPGGGVEPCMVRQLSAGGDHTCAALVDGRALCWGSNARGQLGLPLDVPGSAQPVVVGMRVAEVTAGPGQTCVRLVDGSLRCWGELVAGQDIVSPRAIDVGGNASQVVLGPGRGCVLRADGAVMCWGPAEFVGVGDGLDHDAPTALAPFPGRLAVLAMGESATCAVQLDGALFCWGPAAPQGTVLPVLMPTPVPVASFGPDVFTAGVGRGFVCALSRTAELRCSPPDDGKRERVLRVSAGGAHLCFLDDAANLGCLGDNSFGQLDGVPSSDGSFVSPRFVDPSTTWVSVAAGGRHTCGLTSAGRVRCWGDNGFGQLGTSSEGPDGGGHDAGNAADGGADAGATVGLPARCL